MEGEVSDDDLPSISVTCLSQESSMSASLVMPNAGAIAAERAKEQRTEMEIRRLRELHEGPTSAARSDSSGSEGEAALARCVRALRVLPPGAPRPATQPLARALLAALPAAGPPATQLQTALSEAEPAVLRRMSERIIHALSCVYICESNTLTDEDIILSIGLSCVVWLALPSLRARRLLHATCGRSGPEHVRSLAALAASSARQSGPPPTAARALLQLSDAARGGPPAAETFAELLARHALALVLHVAGNNQTQDPPTTESLSAILESNWRTMEATARLPALRLSARLAPRADPTHRTKLLTALAQPPPNAHRHHPDYLNVAVTASTLKLLFRTQQQQQ